MQKSVLPYCVLSSFIANWRVPKFSLNSCAQSSKKTFMCPKFHTNPVFKYIKCHISTNLSNFLKLCLLYCQKLFALAPTNRRFAEKIDLVATLLPYPKLACEKYFFKNINVWGLLPSTKV